MWVTRTSDRNICPDRLKKLFDEKVFCCYEYDHLTQETEETMFQPVQQGIALSPAEKMRAMSTEWASIEAKSCVRVPPYSHHIYYDSRSSFWTNEQSKAKAVPSLQASPQALMRVLEDPEPISMGLKLAFKDVFGRFESLIKKSSSKLADDQCKLLKDSVFDPAPDFLKESDVNHVRTFSPLELVTSGILISYHKDKRSNDALLEDIKAMRRFLRLKHRDLRVNTQCWATAWEFISEHVNPNPVNNFAFRLQSHREKSEIALFVGAHASGRARSGSESSGLSSLDSLFESDLELDDDDSSDGLSSNLSVSMSIREIL
ncbi:b8db7d67-9458-4472-afac-c64092c8f8c3 [Sclerotinia trifoliorum]|uniref:B8db7d67-9458-4472-afac-c64092c8f8c3 n=1 Tax=Sclerotinia trifoliorum TaxID=28548 RepID=A0A8H2ZQA0_9HELO|nr:b8db7d67-9458-4472-afac-c64092c8f8c3 [Sclerotinia trifoliorum]